MTKTSRRKPTVVRLGKPDEEAKAAALKLLVEGTSGNRTNPVESWPTTNR